MSRFVMLAFLGVLLVARVATAGESEPRFKGKPLGYWVERLQKADTDDEQQAAANALEAFGPDAKPAIPILLEMLLDHSEHYRWKVLLVLASLGSNAKHAVPGLIDLLKSKKARDADEIVDLLRQYGPEARDAVPVLVEYLNEPKLLASAFAAICAIGPEAKSAIPALKVSLNELSKPPKTESEIQARKRGERPTVDGLVRHLYGIGPAALPWLLELLESPDSRIKMASAESLADLGVAANVASSRLKDALRSDSSGVRLAVAIALWKINKDPVAVETLDQLTGVDDSNRLGLSVSWVAVQELGTIGANAKSTLPTLRKLLEKSSTEGSGFNPRWEELLKESIKSIEGSDQ